MSDLKQLNSVLMRGLSSFWLRLFHDKPVVDALFEGTETQLGQAYFDILGAVLAPVLDRVPYLHREYWKLVEFRGDEVLVQSADGRLVYDYPVDESIVSATFLYDQVLVPSTILEQGRDYVFVKHNLVTDDHRTFIRFTDASPFTANGSLVPWVPVEGNVRQIGGGAAGTVHNSNGTVIFTPSADYIASDADLSRRVELLSGVYKGVYYVTGYGTKSLTLGIYKGVGPADVTDVKWAMYSTAQTQKAAMWAPDAQIDRHTLSDIFGVLVNTERASSEQYRQLIHGIFQYYINGPSLTNIEAALNLSCGYPVVWTNGEVVTGLPTDSDNVFTDKDSYPLPPGTRRKDLRVGQVLQAFDTLTDAFTVVDAVKDPAWWYDIQLPQESLPRESAARRQSSPNLYPNLYNVPAGPSGAPMVMFGDPGLYYGADDDALLPPVGAVAVRHNFAFSAMERFLKNTTLGVMIRADLSSPTFGPGAVFDLIDSGKPSYVFLYVSPVSYWTDTVKVTDTLEFHFKPKLANVEAST